jgi:hypothetical protein
MALHWDVTDVKDCKVHFPDTKSGEWHPAIFCYAILSMHIGIPRLTAENAAEVYRRVRAYEAVFGGMRSGTRKLTGKDMERQGKSVLVDQYFTRDEIDKLIGIRTNVNTITRAAFDRLLAMRAVSEAVDSVDRRIRLSGRTDGTLPRE